MELTQQVRDYAAAQGLAEADALHTGMQEKSAEFLKKKEIYVEQGSGLKVEQGSGLKAEG